MMLMVWHGEAASLTKPGKTDQYASFIALACLSLFLSSRSNLTEVDLRYGSKDSM
jgi:hypothetical protein